MLFKRDPKKNIVPPPQLPEVVFSSSTIRFVLAMLLFTVQIFLIPDFNMETRVFLWAIVVLFIAGALFLGISSVFLTQDTVEISSCFNRKKQSSALKDYVILVEVYPYYSSFYKYIICLKRKDLVHSDVSKQGMDIPLIMALLSSFGLWLVKKYGVIPVCRKPVSEIENLKEYVESLRSQVGVPMEVVFGSEQAKRDYITGKYKAKGL